MTFGMEGLDESDDSGSSSSSSSGSSSSSSGSSGPEEEMRVPYMVIYTDDEGQTQFAHRPQDEDLQLTFTREDRDDSWSLEYTPSYFERYWMDNSAFQRSEYIVKQVSGCDLRSLLRDDPDKALNAVIESAKVYDTGRELPDSQPCAVCREDLHKVFDETQTINGKLVCSGHTVGEIKESGLMDESGRPSNRMWE